MTYVNRRVYQHQFAHAVLQGCLTEVESGIGSNLHAIYEGDDSASTAVPYENWLDTNQFHGLRSIEQAGENHYHFIKYTNSSAIQRYASQLDATCTGTELTCPSESVENYISNLYEALEYNQAERLMERIKFLASPPNDPDDESLSYGSLVHFVNFIKSHSPQYPDIVLTPNGLLRAEWYQDETHHFIVEFESDGYVRYLSFIRSKKDPNKIERSLGYIPTERLHRTIRFLDAFWCL